MQPDILSGRYLFRVFKIKTKNRELWRHKMLKSQKTLLWRHFNSDKVMGKNFLIFFKSHWWSNIAWKFQVKSFFSSKIIKISFLLNKIWSNMRSPCLKKYSVSKKFRITIEKFFRQSVSRYILLKFKNF